MQAEFEAARARPEGRAYERCAPLETVPDLAPTSAERCPNLQLPAFQRMLLQNAS